MPNRVNQLLVKQYKEVFENAAAVVAIGYPGLGVIDTHTLRGKLAAQGCSVHFVRNRLVDIAFKEMGRPSVAGMCEGQTAFVIGEDAVALARTLVDLAKEFKAVKLRGVFVDGVVVPGAQGVTSLSQSPTKEELKSIISGQAMQPARALSGAALSAGAKLASQIKKLAEKGEGEGEAA